MVAECSRVLPTLHVAAIVLNCCISSLGIARGLHHNPYSAEYWNKIEWANWSNEAKDEHIDLWQSDFAAARSARIWILLENSRNPSSQPLLQSLKTVRADLSFYQPQV